MKPVLENPRFLPERLALAALAGAAVAAFALAHNALAAWAFLLPLALSLVVQWERVPRRLVSGAARLTRAAAGAMILVGLVTTLYPVVSRETLVGLAIPIGYALSAFSALFALGAAAWPPHATRFPAAAGILMAAGVVPYAKGYAAAVIVAAAAAFAWLVVTAGLRRTRPVRLVLSAVVAVAVGVGLFRFLPWAQPRVEAAVAGILGSKTVVYSGLAPYSWLGDIEELALSQTVVMRVWSSEPQNLRACVYLQFNGRTWSVSPGGVRRPLERYTRPLGEDWGAWMETIPGEMWAAPGRTAENVLASGCVRTRIVQSLFNAGALVSPPGVVLARLPSPAALVDPYGVLLPAATDYEVYGVVNRRGGTAGAGAEPAESMAPESLAVPRSLDPRLGELAARLKEGADTAEEKLRRTVAHLQATCRYSLKVGAFESRDPVSEFVFDKKRGYCEYFASALALLLRLEGVPSRYVTGFSLRSDNWEGGHYVVREADAHAWVEAYLPGRGWVEADATPPGEYAALHAGARGGGLAAAWEWLAAKWAEAAALLSGGGPTAALRWLWGQVRGGLLDRPLAALGVVLALLAVLGWRAWRRGRGRPWGRRPPGPGATDTTPHELAGLMRRLERVWTRAGAARPASRAPLEHFRSLPPSALSPELRDAGTKVVECYYRCAFGGRDPTLAEVAELRSGLDRLGA